MLSAGETPPSVSEDALIVYHHASPAGEETWSIRCIVADRRAEMRNGDYMTNERPYRDQTDF